MPMPPDTKTNTISHMTLDQVLVNLRRKRSQFRSLHWNEENSDPQNWNQVYFSHPHNIQVNFDVNAEPMSFSARVI